MPHPRVRARSSPADSIDLRDEVIELRRRLAASEAAFLGIVQRGSDGVVVADRDGIVRFANPAAAAMLGRAEEELVGSAMGFTVVAGEVADVELLGPTGQVVVAEMRVVDTEWEGRHCLLALLRDVTDRHLAEIELAQRATHDYLTGLPNRFLLEDRLAQALERLSRHPGSTALFVADLDDFKSVNDRWGHTAGDMVLIEAAHRLRSVLRPADSVARLGGDEFALLCESMDQAAARELTGRLALAFHEPMQVHGHACTIGLSIGYALADEPGVSPDALLAAADTEMYRHKHRSRPPAANRVSRDQGQPMDVPLGVEGSGAGRPAYQFTLYLAGSSDRSEVARRRVERLCAEHITGGYELKVVDVLRDLPEADAARILVTPTLIRTQPAPALRVVGDLSDTARIADVLDL